MANRVLSTVFCAAVFMVACAGNHKPQPITSPTDTPRRVRILDRDLAWVHDSIPILRYEPPYIYGAWRMQLEACAGLKREGWPRFFMAPVHPLPGNIGGFFAHDSDAIVFAFGNEMEKWIVQHELLHFLLEPLIPAGPKGETFDEMIQRSHPLDYFDRDTGKCGALVNPPRP